MIRVIRQMHVFFAVLAACATSLGLFCVVVVLGPTLEAKYWPVVTDAAITVVSRGEGRMTIDWTATRRRGECQFRGVLALVRRSEDWHAAVLSRAGDGTDAPLEGITRPPGHQRFARLDVIPDGAAIRLTLRHQCHPLWMTTTYLPEVAL